MSTFFEVAVCKIHQNKDLETSFWTMCKFVMSCDLLLNTPPMNDQKTLKNVMSGVIKVTVIFDENNHKIAILSDS